MTDKTKKVLRHLLQDHKGQRNAITQGKLAKKMDMDVSTLRSELRRLREERDIPIGNLRDGYFVIQSKDELEDQISHINREIQSKRERIEDTLEAFEQFDGENIDVEGETDSEPKQPTYECAKCDSEVPREHARHPRQGEYEDQVLCKSCYGRVLMNR